MLRWFLFLLRGFLVVSSYRFVFVAFREFLWVVFTGFFPFGTLKGAQMGPFSAS